MGAGRTAAVVTATVILLTITLIILAAFVGLHRLSEYYAMYVTYRAPRALMSEIYDELQTGDIILFVASTSGGSNSMMTQTFFSHVGMVLREGELAYLSETHAGAEIMPDPASPERRDLKLNRNVSLTPLLTRLRWYTGTYYLMRLARPLNAAREEAIKSEAERLWAARYPYPTLFQSLLGLMGRSTASRHCFQHTAHLLDTAKLTPIDRDGVSLEDSGFLDVCEEICTLPGRTLPDGNVYEPPVQILYDIGIPRSR